MPVHFSTMLPLASSLTPFSGNFSTALGTVAHHIFQDMYQDHFDFEKSYQAALNNNDYQFTEEEQVL